MRAAFENIPIDKSGDLPSGTYFEFHAKYFKLVDVTFEYKQGMETVFAKSFKLKDLGKVVCEGYE